MGKEVKVTASEPLTADKGVRIGKTMGKSDEPTLIPIDEDLGSAKKKTSNKTAAKTSKKISVKGAGGVNKREAEKISDTADALVLDDVKPTKKPIKSVAKKTTAKNAKTGAKAGTKALVMDGMVRQKTVAKAKPVDLKGDLDAKADSLKLDEKELIDEEKGDEAKVKDGIKRSKSKQFSKSKATMVAIGVVVVVGAIGMALMFFLNRPSDQMCTLKFESNGGSKIESQEVVCGTKASRPDDPEKEGFEFQDWLLEGMPFDFDDNTIDKDIIVSAKWLVDADTEVVKITFDTAGGSEVTERETVKGKPTTAPLDPTRDGYTFDGWYLDGEKFDFETPIEEDITLVAGWKDNNSGTVTRPQGNGNNGGTTEKPALRLLSVRQGIIMKTGEGEDFDISVVPVPAEVDLEISSSDQSVVSCTKAGSGRTMSCMAGGAGEATITIRDKLSGKTATTKITVKQEGGGTGGGTTTPTPNPNPTPNPDPDPDPDPEPDPDPTPDPEPDPEPITPVE